MRSLTAALLVAVALPVLMPRAGDAASSASPGKNGRIAFVRLTSGSSPSGVPLAKPPVIYTVAADGTNARPLTAGPYDYEPAWSPDGSLLAFARFLDTDPALSNDSRELFVVEADGSGLTRLTRNSLYEKTPTWSPDGSRLAFERGGAIWIMRADGTRQRLLVGNARAPAWSPDGRWIAFTRGAGSIELIRPNGAQQRSIAQSSYYGSDRGYGEPVEWTPDGRLAFVGRGVDRELVRTMTVDGRPLRSVADGHQPAWSPDGRLLVTTVVDAVTPRGERLDLFAADDSQRRALTKSLYPVQDFAPDWQPLCTRRGSARSESLTGTARNDLLCGLAGDDVLDGRAGLDRVFGQAGSDRVLARDGRFDVVGCGSGSDTVVADRRDLVGVDCERVRRR